MAEIDIAAILAARYTTVELAAFTDTPEAHVWNQSKARSIKVLIQSERNSPRWPGHALIWQKVLQSSQPMLSLSHEFKAQLLDRIMKVSASALTATASLRLIDEPLQLSIDRSRFMGTLERVAKFKAWQQRRVETDERKLGGEPVFQGTRLAVRRIGGALARGVAETELRADYPYLTDEDFEFAALYAKAYRRVGRPKATD